LTPGCSTIEITLFFECGDGIAFLARGTVVIFDLTHGGEHWGNILSIKEVGSSVLVCFPVIEF
jgi:hypothetical protein